MLVQVALIVFAFCAMLSLAVDLGYVRLTQARMQTAADSAALEGLRYRNAVINNAFASDCVRRASANRVARWTLDDDAWETASEAPVGADLQFNRENTVYGDMVSGQFADGVLPPAGPLEDSTYTRTDFAPSAFVPTTPPALPECPAADEDPPNPWPAQTPPQTIQGAVDNAFLVRLRRSNELQGLGAQTEPGVATSGPSVPLTFGQAALVSGDPASTYSPTRDGLTVRATAIAHARPALRVGLPQLNGAMEGVTPFTVSQTFAAGLPGSSQPGLPQPQLTVSVNPTNGTICATTVTTPCAAATSIGRFVDSLTPATLSRRLLINTVGQALPAPAPVTCAAVRTLALTVAAQRVEGYGPVYAPMPSGANRVIGFSRLRMTPPGTCPADPTSAFLVTMFRAASIVAASNATSSLSSGLPLPAAVPPGDVSQLLASNNNGNYGPILAPVLAR